MIKYLIVVAVVVMVVSIIWTININIYNVNKCCLEEKKWYSSKTKEDAFCGQFEMMLLQDKR